MVTHRHENSQGGFGVIESIILILMAFILGIVVLVAYSSASQAKRDAQRATDVVSLQQALKYHYQEYGEYPVGDRQGQAVGHDNNFSKFISKWPQPPTPADGNCNSETNKYFYEQVNGGESYQLKFCLGNDYDGVKAGARSATPTGYH
jgi:Tfp pilus assembly protein PilE